MERVYVAFGGNPKGGKINRKGTIRSGEPDFENVYLVKELKFNLFSVSQICDKKNSVHFNDTECVVLSLDFKLTDENHVLLRVPRKNNMYSVDLKNIIPKGGLTCLFAKATSDESRLRNIRLRHFNFDIMNILVKGNLYSVARTPQQNGVVERRNITLIMAAKTMLADSKLPTTFWAEAVSTACYVQNRVLVVKPHNKTPYVLFHGRTLMLSSMRPFGCHVTILNTVDHLGKFDGKADEGFFVGYSLNSKAFRVLNSRTRIVVETLHIRFSENTPNNMGSRPNWLFDIDALTKTMNHQPVIAGTQSNGKVGIKDNNNAGQARKEKEPGKDYILLSLWTADPPCLQEPKSSQDARFKPSNDVGKKVNEVPRQENKCEDQKGKDSVNSTNRVNVVSLTVNAASNKVNVVSYSNYKNSQRDTQEEGIEYDEVFAPVARIKAIRLFLAYASFKDFVVYQMDMKSAFIYGKIKEEVYVCHPLGFEDLYFPDKVYKVEKALYRLHQALRSWYELNLVALLFFLTSRKHTLSNYLLDNWFHRGKIDKTLFIRRNRDDILLVQVYVDDIIFSSTKKELCNAFEKLMHEKFQMSYMGELTFFLELQVKQKQDGIFISQDKYVVGILKKFRFSEVKTASAPMETQKPLLKDEDGEEILKESTKIGRLVDSPFDLMAYTDSDYAGASLDRKSTIGDCQFHGCRLISWQFKKQTMIANSTTEAEYVDASSCCGQVL
uniref:Putative ribonuclease H-like domain-containing protein n=1 Tax=Tanacetum cinerariifolium TaxID=118510 RepID=A0A6L2N6E5_TANCI|nr:putative ribonuclease H-like domain-containing protein [Tanacetum cinerariifolium]